MEYENSQGLFFLFFLYLPLEACTQRSRRAAAPSAIVENCWFAIYDVKYVHTEPFSHNFYRVDVGFIGESYLADGCYSHTM